MNQKNWRLRRAANWLWLLLALLTISLIGAGQAAADAAIPETYGSPVNRASSPSTRDCSNIGVGFLPLTDMARSVYEGFPGGLYLGDNRVPAQHLQIGMAAGQSVVPLNAQGQPSSSGKIILMSLGMSNTKQAFQEFMRIARGQTNPEVSFVNGALGGYDAPRVADPNSDFWTKLDTQLNDRDLSPLQVQVVWLLEAIADETGPFPQSAQELQGYLRNIVLIVENRYPNVKAIYLTSRAYGGYAAPNSASPEPWAYESGFAVKWLIESQITGSDPALAYANTPWLAWGPYTWADGLNPRSDGLTWSCDDFESDGIHPSTSGEMKLGNMLLTFFNEDPTTPWFPQP